jgi:hypothetical protein
MLNISSYLLSVFVVSNQSLLQILSTCRTTQGKGQALGIRPDEKPTLLHWCSIISFSSFPQLWPQLCRKKTHNRSSQTRPTRKSHKWESNYAATHLVDAWHKQVLLSACHIFLKSCAAIAVSVTTGSCNFKKVAETLETWHKKSTRIIQYL